MHIKSVVNGSGEMVSTGGLRRGYLEDAENADDRLKASHWHVVATLAPVTGFQPVIRSLV